MEQDRTPTEPKPSDSYLKYSGFALQLFGGIGLAAWVGYRLDSYLGLTFPAFLLSFVLIVFAGMLYLIYKRLNKE